MKQLSTTLGLVVVSVVAALAAGCGGSGASATKAAEPMSAAHAGMSHAAMTHGGSTHGGSTHGGSTHGTMVAARGVQSPAVDLRVQLDSLLGEHALLAVRATQLGYSGSKAFPALAKELDRNSVAISQLIGSAYGPAAAQKFLNGKFLWRDHIRFFVQYTRAVAKNDMAGQKKAVANLMRYVDVQAAFFASATGLPKQALANGLTAHILQLKGALDAYSKGRYAQSQRLAHAAYDHMWMTGDQLAGAIVKQKSLSTAGASPKAANLRVTLDRLLGEHALLAIFATQSGIAGSKDFPAVAASLDRNSVALSQAVASVYGKPAGKKFLDGAFLWRDHIRFFVQYTQALAKNDTAGQKKAVANLMRYVGVQAGFFASATALPKQALVNDLTAHVLQLKGQLDAYHGGRYAQSFTLTDAAYDHMLMTGATLAGGIAKQKRL
jgi:hypothetical protein